MMRELDRLYPRPMGSKAVGQGTWYVPLTRERRMLGIGLNSWNSISVVFLGLRAFTVDAQPVKRHVENDLKSEVWLLPLRDESTGYFLDHTATNLFSSVYAMRKKSRVSEGRI